MAQANIKLSNFVFTHNNYTEADFDSLKVNLPRIAKYAVVGKEVGEQQTPHLQGYVQLLKRSNWNSVCARMKAYCNGRQPHIEVSRPNNSQAAATYCMKDGDYWEHGSLRLQGQRTDLESLRKDVLDGASLGDIARNHTSAFLRYSRGIKEMHNMVKVENERKLLEEEYKDANLRPWQAAAVTLLDAQDRRKVLWIYEDVGNTGKSWLGKWLIINRNAYYITGGKHGDIQHGHQGEKVVVFDFSRTMAEKVPYQVIENFKNGVFFSGKYESGMRICKGIKVVCFANYLPDLFKLSLDRWQITQPSTCPVLENHVI